MSFSLSYRARIWSFLVGGVLMPALFVGCSKSDGGGGSGGAGGSEPAAESDAGPNPTPATLAEVRATIDLSKFPAMNGAKYSGASPSNANFMVPGGNVDAAIEFYKAQLTPAGWTPSTDPKLWAKYPTGGAQLLFTKNGHRLYASIGVSPANNDLNAGLFHLGNLDARKLPRYTDAATVDLHPQRVIYTTAAEVKTVRDYLRGEITKLGWKEYKKPIPEGFPKEFAKAAEKELHFLQRGMGIDVVIYNVGGKEQVSQTIRVLDHNWPILDDAANLELQDDPLNLMYVTKSDLPAAVKFCRDVLTAEGWKQREGAGKEEEKSVRLAFDAPGRDPIRLEVLSDPVTFVRLTPWPDDEK